MQTTGEEFCVDKGYMNYKTAARVICSWRENPYHLQTFDKHPDDVAPGFVYFYKPSRKKSRNSSLPTFPRTRKITFGGAQKRSRGEGGVDYFCVPPSETGAPNVVRGKVTFGPRELHIRRWGLVDVDSDTPDLIQIQNAGAYAPESRRRSCPSVLQSRGNGGARLHGPIGHRKYSHAGKKRSSLPSIYEERDVPMRYELQSSTDSDFSDSGGEWDHTVPSSRGIPSPQVASMALPADDKNSYGDSDLSNCEIISPRLTSSNGSATVDGLQRERATERYPNTRPTTDNYHLVPWQRASPLNLPSPSMHSERVQAVPGLYQQRTEAHVAFRPTCWAGYETHADNRPNYDTAPYGRQSRGIYSYGHQESSYVSNSFPPSQCLQVPRVFESAPNVRSGWRVTVVSSSPSPQAHPNGLNSAASERFGLYREHIGIRKNRAESPVVSRHKEFIFSGLTEYECSAVECLAANMMTYRIPASIRAA